MPYGRWDTTENININWSRVFANLPALKTLNLEANYMDSRHVFGALEAASTHCINLETLVLPAQQFGGGDERIQAVLETLYTAMKSKAAGVTPDDDWDDDDFCNRQGYGLDATDPAAALKGCPLLDEVIVKLYHAVDRNMYIPPDMGDADAFPEVEMVNQDVFGDHFCETLASQCPFLTRFVIKELLTTLADTLDVQCTRQKFALRIENWSYNSRHHVDPVWSETYLSDLEELMNRVKDAHPSLRQHVVTMDRSGKRFSRIAEFGLYTTHMEPSVYCNWEDWEHEEENKGITIVDREDLLADDRSFNDDASDFYGYDDEYLGGNFYDGEGESDIDSEYLDDDSDFEM
ncbi:hypothetical protein PInf_024231 [Phytophthora infestans]|nr:hypothetical protein PInf_024231 [Phytophthora infestans]